jgi:hypothetical protein
MVRLHTEVEIWATSLTKSDPDAAHWFAAAVDVLVLHGPAATSANSGTSEERRLLIRCEFDAGAQEIQIVDGCLLGAASTPVRAVTYKFPTPGKGRQRQLGRVSRWLAAATTRLLPAEHRQRYQEENLAELWFLAGVSSSAQLRYGLMLLLTAWPLRRELRRWARVEARER